MTQLVESKTGDPRDASSRLCCVLEQNILYTALYWLNIRAKGNLTVMTEKLLTGM